MNSWNRSAAIVVLIVTSLLHMQPVAAEEPNSDPWVAILRLQLRQSHNCNLAEVLYVREVPLGRDVGLEGRVRCIEGRDYDFTRQRVHQKFDIRLCQPAVC